MMSCFFSIIFFKKKTCQSQMLKVREALGLIFSSMEFI